MAETQKTKIILRSPYGESYEVKAFESLKITENLSNKVKSFSFRTATFDETELKKFSTGTEVFIYSCLESEVLDDHLIFKGIIQSNPKTLDSVQKTYEFSGYDKTALTQNIVVNEVYENEFIHDIVRDLLTKYVVNGENDFKIGYIEEVDYRLRISFKDTFLYSALEKLSDAINFTFFVDLKDFFTFRSISSMTSNDILSIGNYWKGTANFSTDNSRLVNKLTVYGGVDLSPDVTQKIKGDGLNSTFLLNFKPRASSSGSVIVKVNGVQQSIGIKGMTESGVDVLVSYNDQNLTFKDKTTNAEKILSTSDLVEVTYRYENKLITRLSDKASIQQYKTRENILSYPDITDKVALMDTAREYLKKYSKPITTGSLSTWLNKWNIGENVKVEIEVEEGFFMNEWLQITEKSVDIAPNEMKVDLKFEQKKTLDNILKDILERLAEIEKHDENETVQQLDIVNEELKITGLYKTYSGKKRGFVIGKNKLGECI